LDSTASIYMFIDRFDLQGLLVVAVDSPLLEAPIQQPASLIRIAGNSYYFQLRHAAYSISSTSVSINTTIKISKSRNHRRRRSGHRFTSSGYQRRIIIFVFIVQLQQQQFGYNRSSIDPVVVSRILRCPSRRYSTIPSSLLALDITSKIDAVESSPRKISTGSVCIKRPKSPTRQRTASGAGGDLSELIIHRIIQAAHSRV